MARTRYEASERAIPLRALPAAALRAVVREGYHLADLRRDVLAGLVVGVVALPLAMALAVAAGIPPQHGLYTAIVAGFLVAALGGSRMQVTGPTAAFVVIIAPIHAHYGMAGLLVSGLLAGLILIAMGLARLGRLIQYIPHPVVTGFTAGIAVVLAALQLEVLLGLRVEGGAAHFFDRAQAMWHARGTASAASFAVGLGTLAGLILLPRLRACEGIGPAEAGPLPSLALRARSARFCVRSAFGSAGEFVFQTLIRRVPAPLVVLPLAALAAFACSRLFPGFAVETIASRFHTVVGGALVEGIPQLPPLPLLPWLAPGAALPFDLPTLRALLPGAFAIAMLGAIESLLSAVVADGMAGTRHDPDAELLALGVGNVAVPFFGGIPATGAIARTATNVRSGARSPVAAMVHALAVLAAVLALAPLLGHLPMPSLAALLLLVAWNMSEAGHLLHTLRVAPKSDAAVLLTCFGLTVAFDMVVGVAVGMVLAAFLFMRRMAEVTQASLSEGDAPDLPGPLPPGVAVYRISGPLFFGAAQKAIGRLERVSDRLQVVILRLEGVQAMDATGLVALESALATLAKHRCLAILCGVREQPLALLQRAGVGERPGVLVCTDAAEALAAAMRQRQVLPAQPALTRLA